MKMSMFDSIRNQWLNLQGATMRAVPGLLTCAQFDAFICDYLDDKLPTYQALSFRLHLGLCPDCRSYLSAYRTTVELQRRVLSTPDAAVPEEVPEELIQAILSARRE